MSGVKNNLDVEIGGVKVTSGRSIVKPGSSKRIINTPKEGSTVKKSNPNTDVSDNEKKVEIAENAEGANKTPKKRVRRPRDGSEKKSRSKKRVAKPDEKKVGKYPVSNLDCARDMLQDPNNGDTMRGSHLYLR